MHTHLEGSPGLLKAFSKSSKVPGMKDDKNNSTRRIPPAALIGETHLPPAALIGETHLPPAALIGETHLPPAALIGEKLKTQCQENAHFIGILTPDYQPIWSFWKLRIESARQLEHTK